MFWTQLLFTQADAPPADAPSFLQSPTLPMLLIFAVIYFMLLRPRMKEQKAQQEALKALKVDDEVVTTGGIWGKIRAIDDRIVTLEIAKDVKIKVLRSGIAG